MSHPGGPGEVRHGPQLHRRAHEVQQERGIDRECKLQARKRCHEPRRGRTVGLHLVAATLAPDVIAYHPLQVIPAPRRRAPDKTHALKPRLNLACT